MPLYKPHPFLLQVFQGWLMIDTGTQMATLVLSLKHERLSILYYWVISEDSFFFHPSSLCAFLFVWLYNHAWESRSLKLSSAFFCLSIWLTLSMSLSNSLLIEAWLSSSDKWEYQLTVFCYLPIRYKILWFNWSCLSHLFSVLSVFLILIK